MSGRKVVSAILFHSASDWCFNSKKDRASINDARSFSAVKMKSEMKNVKLMFYFNS